MLKLDKLQRPVPGLAHTLDEPSFHQDYPISLTPQNNKSATACLEPQKAITIVLDQHDDIIFAYLRLARSLNQNIHYPPSHGSLSNDQFLAVKALRDCADDEIRTWLEQARELSSDPRQPKHPLRDTLQDSGFAYPYSLLQAPEVLQGLGRGASVHAPVKAVQTKGLFLSTPDDSGAHPRQTPEKINTLREATKTANLYWCTICIKRRHYQSLWDWRKHEKGHVDKFVCMLGGPLEETKGGLKCILCGKLNPSEKHLSEHNIRICEQGRPGSFSCKRRTELVKHLEKCHDVQGKAQGEVIADKWKETTKKQAWSCGFCIHLTNTFGDRLKHIATHFERGQTLDEWDTTKVIEGLLLQPGMVNVCQTQLVASSLGCEPPGVIWEKHLVEDLQRDLEVGPSDTKHAVALAKAAYRALQSRGRLLNSDKPLAFTPNHGARESSAIVPTSDYDPITERAFNPNPNHEPSQYVANPAETLHYQVPALAGVSKMAHSHGTFPASSSNDDSTPINAPWLVDHGQTWTSAADQCVDSEEYGYQEHSDATPERCIWPTPPGFSDEADTDNMIA